MTNKRRVGAALGAATLGAGAMLFATAGAASAAPDCVADGVGRYINEAGLVEIGNDSRCGELYQYETPPQFEPEPVDPAETGTGGCLTGIVGDISCDRPQDEWTVPHPIWETPPGGTPIITGWEYPDGTVTVGEPETVPDEGNVEVGEPEPVTGGGGGGGGGGGSYGGGGGFIGGGSYGGGSSSGGTVTVGEVETVAE